MFTISGILKIDIFIKKHVLFTFCFCWLRTACNRHIERQFSGDNIEYP